MSNPAIPQKADPASPHSALQTRLDALAQKRGVAPWFEAFTLEVLDEQQPRLQLCWIESSPDAPTLVFMPGTNAYALLYGEFLAAMAQQGQMNVIGFDPRGHGLSSGARGSYTFPELLSDLDRVVQFARSRFSGPLFVGGSSQGGIASFYYAASGANIAGAFCHNAADLGSPEAHQLTRFPRISQVLAPFVRLGGRFFPELRVPMSAYLDLRKEPVQGVGTAWDVLHGDPDLVTFVRLKTLASLSYTPLPRPLEDWTTPIFLLQAGQDSIFPTSLMERLCQRLHCPKTFQVYPDLHHYCIVDAVPAFLTDLLDWIQDITSNGVLP